jgi:hypothetical protein
MRTVPSFARTVKVMWRTLVKDVADPYRPELHYMRGPGPKWREKHGMSATSARTDLPGLAEATA